MFLARANRTLRLDTSYLEEFVMAPTPSPSPTPSNPWATDDLLPSAHPACIDHGHTWCKGTPTLTQAVESMTHQPHGSIDALLNPPPDAALIMWCILGIAALWHAIVYRIARRSGGAR